MLIKKSCFLCTHLLEGAFIPHAACGKALPYVYVLRLATGNDQMLGPQYMGQSKNPPCLNKH